MKKELLGVVLASVAGLGVEAGAVQTSIVAQRTEAQFKEGKTEHVLINSEGEISLGYQATKLLGDSNDVWVVNALVEGTDGSVYAATSGKGRIYRLREGQAEVVYEGAEQGVRHIFSLAWDIHDRLLAGTGGEEGVLLRQGADGEFEQVLCADTVDYVWSIAVGADGRIYLGTGPEGQIWALDADGAEADIVYDAKESHILCLAADAEGGLYAGGDKYGLVYRMDGTSGAVTVVYDSVHSEISSLVLDKQGVLYAATADAGAARPGARLILSDGRSGRPEEEGAVHKKEVGGASPGEEAGGAGRREGQEGQSGAAEKADGTEKADQGREGPAGDSGGGGAKKDGVKAKLMAGLRELAAQLRPPVTGDEGSGREKPEKVEGGIGPAATKPAKANEVYRITPQGYVETVFQKAVVILDLAESAGGKLLLGTGNEGQLIQLDVAAQEAVVLHKVDPSVQVSSVLVGTDGTIYAGCANPGAVVALKQQYAAEGRYDSQVIDAKQVSRWGRLQIEADIPGGTALLVATRTGNTEDPEQGGWQEWTEPVPATDSVATGGRPGRFLQYRLILRSADGKATPVVREVKVAHLLPNLRPRVTGVEVSGGGKESNSGSTAKGGQGGKKLMVRWRAEDENGDKLRFSVFIRPVGVKRWIQVAKDLDESQWSWDIRTVADGRYEVKVEASDAPSNVRAEALTEARVSRVVVVDNTPPQVDKLAYEVQGHKVVVETAASDELSTVAGIAYCLDSAEAWEVVLPHDEVFDSREETARFTTEVKEAGEHVLALRYEDASGNRVYKNVTFSVGE